MKKLLTVIIIVLFSSISCKAQDTLTGTLPAWDKGQADIGMFIGFMVEPLAIGSVDESGTFIIPLTDDILEKTKKAMEEYNSGSSDGELSLNTLEKVFQCYDEEAITVTNGDQQPAKLTMMGVIPIMNLEKKKNYAFFMATNSRAFAEAFGSRGKKDMVKGFYLDWYYVEEPATVQGTCSTKTYTQSQKESYEKSSTYDLDFKQGWNMVKISTDETFTDSEGKVYASKWTYQTTEKMPEAAEFLLFFE